MVVSPLKYIGGGQGGMSSIPRRAASMTLGADLRGALAAGKDVELHFELKTCINNIERALALCNSFIDMLE